MESKDEDSSSTYQARDLDEFHFIKPVQATGGSYTEPYNQPSPTKRKRDGKL